MAFRTGEARRTLRATIHQVRTLMYGVRRTPMHVVRCSAFAVHSERGKRCKFGRGDIRHMTRDIHLASVTAACSEPSGARRALGGRRGFAVAGIPGNVARAGTQRCRLLQSGPDDRPCPVSGWPPSVGRLIRRVHGRPQP